MKIDVVIKVGGSLGRWGGVGKLLDSVEEWRGAANVLVVPGGGVFADLVRAEYRRVRLTESAAHRMAILAMDQYGLELCDLASRAAPASSLNQVREVIRSGRLPVYLPSRSLARHDPFTPSWRVTSDSIAAYIAGCAKANSLLLLKSVDGIFARDPKVDPSAPLLPRITRSHLSRDSGVDREFARWLNGIDCCWIINGRRPARVKEWLECRKTVGTCVITRSARRKK
ncbi:MAG: aspartate/glutamate/uridylate kinase [Candidatus Methylomirabilis oxygeniifera]|uniref:Putative Delta 1-pyrroline-5-carboxylate synthetase n=1 Tax=Methylomirabilis oxygeniifera TaxID=671143 RepID=D5MKC4_METO1|nr:MAG: aspartate/glutamate/uridylate kinase [Candidatus Methylomirabilis oxyfera]CBE69746.1 putative Delta 1-pyrroline-5-carboxylate synthetase [Candidatus Methylomirabilis oxyfera]